MLSEPAVGVVNHLLQGADWARERLAPFAGARLRFEVPPVSSTFTITSDGLLGAGVSTEPPAATVRVEPLVLFRIAVLRDEPARQLIRVQGDAELAAAFTGVLANLNWDAEDDLSRVLGDVAAHRAVRAATALYQWQLQMASNLAGSIVEYATEEQPIIAGADALKQFVAEVDAIREDVERVEKRIERLISDSPPARKS